MFDPRGGQWSNGRYVPSLVAAIGEVIERHMIATGFLAPAEPQAGETAAPADAAVTVTHVGPLCPRCSQPGLVSESGCLSCVHCGWSKCG